MHGSRHAVHALAAVGLAALCWGTWAQEAGSGADAARPVIEEIIVSAQKRDESIQEVPDSSGPRTAGVNVSYRIGG